MFKVQYAGPKVEISHHGVKYNDAKDDKYVYLVVALEILQGIDNDYAGRQSYTHHFENKVLEEEILHKILSSYEDHLEERVEEEERNYELMIEHEIDHVQDMQHLTKVDKEVWIKNIELMKAYRIQREINKIYYGHCIKDILQVIKKKEIKELTTPFNKDFFHVMNTINNVLSTDIYGKNTKLTEEKDKDDNLVIKLYIKI